MRGGLHLGVPVREWAFRSEEHRRTVVERQFELKW